MKNNSSIEGVGPFGEAERRLREFASNFYLNELYSQTLRQLTIAEEQLNAAVLEGDVIKIETAKGDLELLEEIIKLTTANYTSALPPTSVEQ